MSTEIKVDIGKKDIVAIILAFLFPPIAAWLKVGFGGHFWLNVLLTLLGFFPGTLHALYLIAVRNNPPLK